MDMLEGMLMDLIGFMKGMAEVSGIFSPVLSGEGLGCIYTWLNIEKKRNATLTIGENYKEIDFVVIKKNTDGLY